MVSPLLLWTENEATSLLTDSNLLLCLIALIALFFANRQVSAMVSANKLARNAQIEEAKRANETAQRALAAAEIAADRTSKARAVDLILHWTRELSAEMMLARKIGLAIEPGDEIFLVRYQQLRISPDGEIFLRSMFPTAAHAKDGHKIIVPPEEVVQIRTWLVKYLNSLEGIMVAWSNTAVDKKILEEEFTYFVQGNGALDAIRSAFDSTFENTASGSEQLAYPYIGRFVRHVRADDANKAMPEPKRNEPASYEPNPSLTQRLLRIFKAGKPSVLS